MPEHVEKSQNDKSRSVAHQLEPKKGSSEATFSFVDNRPEAVAQKKLQYGMNRSPQATQATWLQAITHAQGADVHVAPGQERHLPHEALHEVQQRQGRVKPILQAKGIPINEDAGLEYEADVMVSKAQETHDSNRVGVRLTNIGEQVIQRATMADIDQEQQTAQGLIGQNNGPVPYTTVGLEWNLVSLDSNNYLFSGKSHIELAQSNNMVNGLRYILETESSDRLEFVAPPFFVPTTAPNSTQPDYHALTDLIEAQRNALNTIVAGKNTIGALMGNWAPFHMNMAPIPGLAGNITDRNWSYNANDSSQDVQNSLQAGNAWLQTPITGTLLNVEDDYQINIAVDAGTYDETYDANSSRIYGSWYSLNRDPYHVQDFQAQATRLTNAINNNLDQVNGNARDRLETFNRQAGRVILQHYILPYLDDLRRYQAQQADQNQANPNAQVFRSRAHLTSFIKDMANVWLKTDLITFGESALDPADWQIEFEALTGADAAIQTVITGGAMPPRYTQHGSASMRAFYSTLKMKVGQKALLHRGPLPLLPPGEVAIDMLAAAIQQLQQEYVASQQTLTGTDGVPGTTGLFGHDPTVAGVRQDTFIPTPAMTALTTSLQKARGRLMVMEIRNPESYREYLRNEQIRGWLKSSGWFSMAGWKKRGI